MRVIVIGGGYWGRKFIETLGYHCIAVVDISLEKLNEVNQLYNVPTYTFNNKFPNYDAAIIATPPDTHVEIALPILQENKLVLIEKPLATSLDEGYKLYKYKRQIMSGLVYLYHPQVEYLKQKTYEIPIHHIFTRRTNNGPIRSWQNAAWDLAPHDISICNYVLQQEPLSVSGISERDFAVITLDYIACQAVIYVSWLGGPKTRLVELVPADKPDRIIFDDMILSLEVTPLRRMVDDFLSGEWHPKASFENGMSVVKVLEELHK